MSDGGGESVRESENSCGTSRKKKKVGLKEEFPQAIARIAAAQICEGVGFQNVHQSALDTLSDVGVRYIREVGKIANLYANLAGRNQCNVFDVIEGLEDLGSNPGFSGASDVNHCDLGSGAIKDIIRFVNEAEEIPFAYSIPSFPVVKDRKLNPSYLQTGENPPEHIPAWLPALPDPKSLNLAEKKETDNRVVKAEQVEVHRTAGRSLLNLQQQLVVNGHEAAVAVDPADAAEEKRRVECNPFLAPPLQFGEKEVSQVCIPAKLSDDTLMQQHSDYAITRNHDSELDAFAPATEAVQSRSSNHEEDGGKTVLLEQRTAVRFRLESHRKTLGRAASTLWDEGDEELDSCFVNDNEKVNRKRTAEQILKSSMNNSQEQAHL